MKLNKAHTSWNSKIIGKKCNITVLRKTHAHSHNRTLAHICKMRVKFVTGKNLPEIFGLCEENDGKCFLVPDPEQTRLLCIQTSFLFFIGRHSPVNSQCPEAVTSFPRNIVNYSTELSKKQKLLDADDATTSRLRKLQNSKNGLQQFGKLIARVFLLQIFSCIYRCFECIIKQLLDLAYA